METNDESLTRTTLVKQRGGYKGSPCKHVQYPTPKISLCGVFSFVFCNGENCGKLFIFSQFFVFFGA
jgi:hypothetical protein